LFFTANDSRHGRELWTSDGTEGETVLVKDIQPGFSGSSPEQLMDVSGRLFLSVDDGIVGQELWAAP